MSTLQPFPAFLPSTPRIVSNKENSPATPIMTNKVAQIRPTARPTKPRMGGIGRPKHVLFKHRQPSSAFRRKSDRLASIKRAKKKSQKIRSLQDDPSKHRGRPTVNGSNMEVDKENTKGIPAEKSTLPTIIEKPSSIMSSLPFPLIAGTTISRGAAPVPQIKVEQPTAPQLPARVSAYVVQARDDLDKHKPGEPYGYLHIASNGSTQCLPFGFPTDVYAIGPIIPQTGDHPVFMQPDGKIVLPVGYAKPDDKLQEVQRKIYEQKMAEYKRDRQARARQKGSPPYARPLTSSSSAPTSSHSSGSAIHPSLSQQANTIKTERVPPHVCAQESMVCLPGQYVPRGTHALTISTPLHPPPQFAAYRFRDSSKRSDIDHPIYANVFGNHKQPFLTYQSYHQQLSEARRLEAAPVHVGPRYSSSTATAREGGPSFTTLFPKMPERILEQAGDHPVWPFHVVPLEVQIPYIPPIVKSCTGGVRLPGEYVVERLVDWLPKVYETCSDFQLMPKQGPPQYIDTPLYPYGPRDDDMYDHLDFWHLKSVYHGGMTDEGRRAISSRGPDMCLVLRDRGKPDTRGIFVPINSTILRFTCANFERLLQHGRSMRGRGRRYSSTQSTEEPHAASTSRTISPLATHNVSIPPPRNNPMAIDSLVSPVSLSASGPSSQATSTSTATAAPNTDQDTARRGTPHVPASPIRIQHGGQINLDRSPGQTPPVVQHSRPGHDDISRSELDGCTSHSATTSMHNPTNAEESASHKETTSDSDESMEDAVSEASSTVGPSSRGTVTGSRPSLTSASTQARSSSEQVLVNGLTGSTQDSASEKLFARPDPEAVDFGAIDFDNVTHNYGARQLPLQPIYIENAEAFFILIYIIHHPRNVIVGELLGLALGPNVESTAQIETALFALSPLHCLQTAERFDRIVQTLTVLGVASKQVWDQVVIANRILIKVLVGRRGIPNMKYNKLAVPYMEGDDLPPLIFNPFTPNMTRLHYKFADEFEERETRVASILPNSSGKSE